MANDIRFKFHCAACGTQVAYRDNKRGYVHVDHRVCGGSAVAAQVVSTRYEVTR